MFFSITNPYKLDKYSLKANILTGANRKILLFPFHETERFLDEYLFTEFGLRLKTACLQILFSSQIQQTTEGDTLVIIPNKQLDRLASLITYGVNGHCGSNILQIAFSN